MQNGSFHTNVIFFSFFFFWLDQGNPKCIQISANYMTLDLIELSNDLKSVWGQMANVCC